ncbi:carboxyl-terminal-processing peptidase 1, chloroplastic-like isoform X1 [Zingiber officinale]|uniref:carboxyl-terminal-processing peptidase 1, chloroplastic-like isoform X1 n=1 Tax=Zingiber officinale TaxID=94328 RepID=UPI001C4C3964|nr:carboxyl-terminal-processing peptidase 1, chloroplastic-like isoform X1 [Zingiber officinale]XP_042390109.1 carboxyl-terminal-processing peptidase 1, chloroplastic-like isoform X1 [Zingiber officinale]XP_042390110.1 carboxyl-terminal-processing peptidase 1, chloroplastic-like isoform X1 [Zingiber officinale]XP_042390111.1 carboxyl-terminal-processing peptidase 1, chloroplastic-like isoform X1 [Zingiber officinale]
MRSTPCSLPLPPASLAHPRTFSSLLISSSSRSTSLSIFVDNHRRQLVGDDDGTGISHHLRNLLLRTVAGALSLSLVVSPAFGLADPSPALCREEDGVVDHAEVRPESITNKGLVEEAWEVVNESFLPDAGGRTWSQENWMQKKQDFLSSRIQTRSRAHDIIKKMLATLGDPYTRFLSPTEFSKMAKYDVTGIGINLREVPDDNSNVKLKVLGIILDGPAYSAGVRQGDELLSVNGVDVRGKSAFDVSSLLQGPQETFVVIKVKHGNCGPIQSMKIERQLVAHSPIFYRLEKLEAGDISVGYIRIKEFNALAKKDLVIALKRLKDAGASYFILDLKDNLGGLVQAGIEVAKLFLNKGEMVIHTVGRDPEIQKSIVAENTPFIASPLIVLVNHRTASASEIVTTALHDNCKAVLVGEKTFGKGLIQSVYELHDGSGVVVTVGKYVTPKNKDINGNGVEPDFQRLPALNEVISYLSQCHIEGKS